jgi:hypothetical protein
MEAEKSSDAGNGIIIMDTADQARGPLFRRRTGKSKRKDEIG